MNNSTPMPGTALPWHVYSGKLRPQFGTQIIEIQAAKGAVVNWGGFDGLPRARAKKDATYIAWAANNAPALLSALEKAADAIFAAGLTADNTETWREARAAIASARHD